MENIHYYNNHQQKIAATVQPNVQDAQANVAIPQTIASPLVNSVGSGNAASAIVACKRNGVNTAGIVATAAKVPITAALVLKISSVLFVSLLIVLFKRAVSFISVSFVLLPFVSFKSTFSVSMVPLITVLLVFVVLLSVKIVVMLSSKTMSLFSKFLSEMVPLIFNRFNDSIWTALAGPMLKILKPKIS